MRKTEEFRPEDRGTYGRECRGEYGKGHGRACESNCGKADHENIYRELTKEGQRFCAAAGLLEEVVVLAVFGIRVSMSPIPVLAFLWVLFVILTAAALIGASCLLDRLAALRAVPKGHEKHEIVNPLPARRTVAAGRRVRNSERIAA